MDHTIVGSSPDIPVDPCQCESEIRMDIIALNLKPIRIWGQILSCIREPIPNAFVKLVKVICVDNNSCYKEIAQTCSDCNGYYEFYIYNEERACYKILVGKTTTGNEVILTNQNHSTCSDTACTNTTPTQKFSSSYCEEDCDCYIPTYKAYRCY